MTGEISLSELLQAYLCLQLRVELRVLDLLIDHMLVRHHTLWKPLDGLLHRISLRLSLCELLLLLLLLKGSELLLGCHRELLVIRP